MPQRTYAVIGLGAIGLGMAQSLLRADLNVIGCNRGPGPLKIFAGNGGRTTHDLVREAAKAATCFFCSGQRRAGGRRSLRPGSGGAGPEDGQPGH